MGFKSCIVHYSCLVWALNLIMEILCGKGVGLVRGGYRNLFGGGGLFYFPGVTTITDTFQSDLRPLCTPLRVFVAQLAITVNPGP